jgi:Cysteine sulfinate desulfinase/cysteine desulfurase and related enzymes
MNIYFDNAATTVVLPEVADIVYKVMTKDYANPSSLHMKGVEAERYIKKAKEQLANILKVNKKEIIFTSGGTESNNMALIGTAFANKRSGKHIIVSGIEHSSVSAPIKYLEEECFKVTVLPVDSTGRVIVEKLTEVLCADTIIVSVMYVNNEIGTIQPISEIAEAIKQSGFNPLLHVDAIQGFGKFKIHPKKLGIDLLSISGHKFHAPKGVGALYIADKVKINSLLYGGGQQNDLRSGTENVPAVAALGLAADIAYKTLEQNVSHMYALRNLFIKELKTIPEVFVNGALDEKAAPHILNISFKGVRSEVLLHTLEEKGIYVSAGSACTDHKNKGSNVLKNIGLDKDLLETTIRFSFNAYNTGDEVLKCVEVIKEQLPILRRFSRK